MNGNKEKSVAPTAPKLPPNEVDLPERVDGFNKELVKLLGKYELGLAAQAIITREGLIAANPIIVSVRKQPELDKEEGKDTGLSKPE
jgi:hypothetical protein